MKIIKLNTQEYFGNTVFKRDTTNYHLSITRHISDKLIPLHTHKNPYISLNLGPHYLEKGIHAESMVKQGQMVMRPSFYEHQNTFMKGNGLCFNIEICHLGELGIHKLFNDLNIQPAHLSLFQLLTKALKVYEEDELDILISEFLCHQEEYYHHQTKPIWYRLVLEQVHDKYDQTLSLSELAASANIHPNYLARKFKHITGTTMGEYIRGVRLKQAYVKIVTEKVSLSDITYQLGFYDQPHFSNTFYSAFQARPKALRQSFARLI